MKLDTISAILFAIFVVCFLASLLIDLWLYRLNAKTRVQNRVDTFVERDTKSRRRIFGGLTSRPDFQRGRFEGMREEVNRGLSFFSNDALRLKITSANWPITDVEFVFIRFLIVLIGVILGWVISQSIIGGLGLAIVFYFIPGLVLDRSIANRRKKFQDQLVDFLVLVRGAILIGYSLPQALDLSVKEIPAPISEEFAQVLREIQFGLTLEEALHNLEIRMQSDDLQIVVTAIILNSQMGGNLSTILEATIETIRERIQLFGEVRALTSYSRFVGLFISVLPLILALLIFLLNPRYFDTVRSSFVTQMILLVGLFGIIIGNVFIRRIVKIRI